MCVELLRLRDEATGSANAFSSLLRWIEGAGAADSADGNGKEAESKLRGAGEGRLTGDPEE